MEKNVEYTLYQCCPLVLKICAVCVMQVLSCVHICVVVKPLLQREMPLGRNYVCSVWIKKIKD